jgi:hypothetical protein
MTPIDLPEWRSVSRALTSPSTVKKKRSGPQNSDPLYRGISARSRGSAASPTSNAPRNVHSLQKSPSTQPTLPESPNTILVALGALSLAPHRWREGPIPALLFEADKIRRHITIHMGQTLHMLTCRFASRLTRSSLRHMVRKRHPTMATPRPSGNRSPRGPRPPPHFGRPKVHGDGRQQRRPHLRCTLHRLRHRLSRYGSGDE